MELKDQDRRVKTADTYERYNGVKLEDIEEKEPHFFSDLPVSKARKKNALMLDLNSINSNWLIAASKKKYIPIGIAQNIQTASTVLDSLRRSKTNGYVIVADPVHSSFQSNLFDLIWSFTECKFDSQDSINEFAEMLSSILAKSGQMKLTFNRKHNANHQSNSFPQQAFRKYLSAVTTTMHSCFGKPALKDQLRLVKGTQKAKVFGSLLMAQLSNVFPGLNYFSDSIYLNAQKSFGHPNFRIHHFLKYHWLKENLNIVYLLQCPISGGPVYLSKDSRFVISDIANVKYPVVNEIPIMLNTEAVGLDGNKTMRESFKILPG